MTATSLLADAFDTAISELDSLLGRVLCVPADLWLDFDRWSYPQTPWHVKDGARKDSVLYRFSDRSRAVSFMERICADHPGSRIDYDSLAVHP